MNYLVKVNVHENRDNDKPSLEDLLLSNWIIIEHIESDSLFDINKIIVNKGYPYSNNILFFRENNYTCIYRFNQNNFLYLLSNINLLIKQKIRDIKLSELYER